MHSFFYFIQALKFEVSINDDAHPEFKVGYDKLETWNSLGITDEHHHPVCEEFTGIESTEQDLLDMALGHLGQNIQLNQGNADLEPMHRVFAFCHTRRCLRKKQ